MDWVKIVNARLARMEVSDADVARALGWSSGRWSSAKNSASPTLRTLKVLACVVGLEVSELLGEEVQAISKPIPEGLSHVEALREEMESASGEEVER